MSNKLSINFLLDDKSSSSSSLSSIPTQTAVSQETLPSNPPSQLLLPSRRHSLPILQSVAQRLDPETSVLLQNWQPTGILKPNWTFLSNVTLSTSSPTSPVASPRGSIDFTHPQQKPKKDLMNYLTFQQHLNQVSSGMKIQTEELTQVMDSASQKLLDDSSEENAGAQKLQEDEIDVYMRRVRAQAYCTILSNTKQFKSKTQTFKCPFADDCIKMLKGKGNLRRHLEWHMKRLETQTREQYPQYSTRIKPQIIFHDPLGTFSNIKMPDLELPPNSSTSKTVQFVNPSNNNNNNAPITIPDSPPRNTNSPPPFNTPSKSSTTTSPKPDKQDTPCPDQKKLELEAAQAMTQLLAALRN